MSSADTLPVGLVTWTGAVRIIRSAFPPIDLFEDIADPADWPLLISAEQKTNPRIMTSTEALENEDIPENLLVVGGGYIGMELGTVYATLGSKVVLVEALDAAAPIRAETAAE